MQSMDRHAIDQVGIPAAVLMEVAGRAVADAAAGLLAEVGGGFDAPAVLCLAGTGNNGGDAVVAARHLRERGHEVTVLVLGEQDQLSEDARRQLRIANALGLDTILVHGPGGANRVADALVGHQLVIDGLFGTGLSRPVEGWRREVIEALEAAPHPVVAVDIPSGIDSDTGQVLGEAVTADITVAFQFPKIGQLLHPGRARCGELRVVDIGIPPSRLSMVQPVTTVLDDDTIDAALPPRAGNSHKGHFGHLLVVAGSPDRPGSALLAARAAVRAGAGLVTVGSDRETIARLAPALVEVMGHALGTKRIEGTSLTSALSGKTALAIGPSLPPDEATRALLHEVLGESRVPAVLDAGALSSLGEDTGWLARRPAATVITPHPGEAGRLLGLDSAAVQSDRMTSARQLVDRSGAVVVLKGATTIVAGPDGTSALSLRGNPGMATAGTGDVLVGIIGALLAQGVEPLLAAQAGVELHGQAGDRASERLGERAVTASDVVHHLAL